MREFMKPDIEDSEIRIIGSDGTDTVPHPRSPRRSSSHPRLYIGLTIVVLLLGAVLLVGYLLSVSPGHSSGTSYGSDAGGGDPTTTAHHPSGQSAYVEAIDTIVGGVSMTILYPCHATPTLSIGTEVMDDTDAVLAVQAADVREDNGEIVGAFVVEGSLVSKGRSKSGFCAIIDGIPTIGVADATPYLERAIESDGYFFRQYPLVVAGHAVDNKPKGASERRALVELHDRMAVVLSHERLTFGDFSEALVSLGVTNAIYLVGSSAYGFARDDRGSLQTFGEREQDFSPHTNFIVWH